MHPLLISALLSAAISFGAAWQIQGWRMDSYKLEVANEQLAREQSSREQLAEAQAKVAAAQDAAQVATDRVRRDAAGAGRADVGMRNALAGAVRAASTDLQACARQVDALSVVFAESATAYRELAEETDGWAIQAVTLQSANPNAGNSAATGQTSPTAGQTN